MRRLAYRGGNWNNTSNAGVFYVNGNNSRSNANTSLGFRSALPPHVRSLALTWHQDGTGETKGSISVPSEIVEGKRLNCREDDR